MKKLIGVILLIFISFIITSCEAQVSSQSLEQAVDSLPEHQSLDQTKTLPLDISLDDMDEKGKVVVFSTSSITEESLFYSHIQSIYPDRVILCIAPSPWYWKYQNNAELWVEDTWSLIERTISNELVKAFIIKSFHWSDYIEIISKVREYHPDILLIDMVGSIDSHLYSDLVIPFSDLVFGRAIKQAKLMGLETFVFYVYWEEMMSLAEIIRTECEKHGIAFIMDTQFSIATANPDNILSDIGEKIRQYGNNTMFISNASPVGFSRVPLENGAVTIFLPYPEMINVIRDHTFFLNLDDKTIEANIFNYNWQQERIKEIVAMHNAVGRLAVWRIPFEHVALTAAIEYAISYLDGEIESTMDFDALYESFIRAFELLDSPNTGFELLRDEEFDNIFHFLQEFLVF